MMAKFKFGMYFFVALLLFVFFVASAMASHAGSVQSSQKLTQINPTPLEDIVPVILGLIVLMGIGYVIYRIYGKRKANKIEPV